MVRISKCACQYSWVHLKNGGVSMCQQHLCRRAGAWIPSKCVLLSPSFCLCRCKGEACWPHLCVTQIPVLLLDYEVLHPFALESLCLVFPGSSERTEGGEGGQLGDFWLLPGMSEPGNVLNERCVLNSTCLSSKQLLHPKLNLWKSWTFHIFSSLLQLSFTCCVAVYGLVLLALT